MRAAEIDAPNLHRQVVDLVRAFGLLQTEQTPCGVPVRVSEAHVLTELAGEPGLTQSALAQRLRLDRSTVCRLVATMVDRDWVTSAPDRLDPRRSSLGLTDQGQDLAAQITTARARRLDKLLDAVSPAERQLVLRALSVVTQAIQREDHR